MGRTVPQHHGGMLRNRTAKSTTYSGSAVDGEVPDLGRGTGLVAGVIGLLLIVVVLSVAISENFDVLMHHVHGLTFHITRAVTPTRVIVEVKDNSNKTLKILDAPVPFDCYMEKQADYDGEAVKWGLGNKAVSAADCCQMCKDFAPAAGGFPCNIWVWCGDPSGECWTPDIHSHKTGDCWLKFQSQWDQNVDKKKSNLAVNSRGKYSEEYRKEHKTAPEYVAWVAGVVRR